MTQPDRGLDLWNVLPVAYAGGGPYRTPREAAPLGRMLDYRRGAGQAPGKGVFEAAARGYTIDLGFRSSLSSFLMSLAVPIGIAEATAASYTNQPIRYSGSRGDLMRRASMPVLVERFSGRDTVTFPGADKIRLHTRPKYSPQLTVRRNNTCTSSGYIPPLLDPGTDGHVDVHSSIAMRYYLETERLVGKRLSASYAPLPRFHGYMSRSPRKVGIVSTPTYSSKDPRAETASIVELSESLDAMVGIRPSLLCVEAPKGETLDVYAPLRSKLDILDGHDLCACIDALASCVLVVGPDTGLTHLAALTIGPDGSSPIVVTLYSNSGHRVWTTGCQNQYGLATPFSQMLTLGNVHPGTPQVDPAWWEGAVGIGCIGPDVVAAACSTHF